ncbi:transcription-repair coupling factor [Anaerococcus lactolyticus ATCC 51172]|uniref:Transcription-repair-coupling factor n=1 Tax=Anaerococcus lactolyticus ATCC 51172 TaxID=525254 RepID=C2BDI7_9FIRM|nr:transcription-repair coupling factor [Anaerococcus lactolyticus]EEI87016.1 transcription-repair coupling factor [Anaerococcus lactolyticus ATCC 51172]
MNKLIEQLINVDQIKKIKYGLKDYSPLYIQALTDGIKAHLALAIFELLGENVVFITDNPKRSEKFLQDINQISAKAKLYPDLDTNFYNIKSIDDKKINQRLECLISLSKGEKFITVTNFAAIKNKLTTLDRFNKSFVIIDEESIIDVDDFINSLSALNYNSTDFVEERGDFAKRGSIIDIWPINYEDPVRIELFDDEVDSIRIFDKNTQRTIKKIKNVEIGPANELLYDSDDYKKVIKAISNDIDKKEVTNTKDQKLVDKYKQIISFLDQKMYVANKDLINAYRTENYSSFIDYLPAGTIFIFDDISRIYESVTKDDEKFLEDLTYQMENGEVFGSFANYLLDSSEIYKNISEKSIINFTSILKRTKLFSPRKIIDLKTIEAENFNKDIENFIRTSIDLAKRDKKVYVFAGSKSRKENLLKSFIDHDFLLAGFEENSTDFDKTPIIISDKNSSEGYYIKDVDLFVFTSKEVFGKTSSKKNNRKKVSSKNIINYSDLEIGDYVVHENNGIGIYKGLTKIERNDVEKDFILIEYRGNDKLYIPVDQMNLVSKYIGNRGEKPKLSALGSLQWQKSKQRAKKAVDEIADDLVKLYAKRAKEKGHAFSKDTTWQVEFENSFPYDETFSQLRSIEEIKADMESENPMDRLLCGDVGYGKTEVALRAAFKAIMDGYQVAFLVPTTILANQHYHTMVERFKDFPITCAMLSRFNTKAKDDKILKDIKSGKIDIVVGTHRLLSDDVKFNKLGLLIIDEEQRFGVKHKEKFKKFKASIDVLTLSATPIPRTLQMSLSGIRDLSTLDDPPEERLPVNTYVLEFDSGIIRDAILKEINRNGQVYFVYNRVNDIEKLFLKIKDLVPEASIEIVHGQMSPRQIENIMMDFIDGKIDILLATTIIETGMDIKNVNTIVIYDSDLMGLSQLYQLKGRIGRGYRSSYAYFTYRSGKILTEIGEKRLKSIRDFSDFGSGYKIAMKDLELRGAGNLLGESQSGHVEAVGYDLYVKFLQEAVEKASGKEVKIKLENQTFIDIKIDAYIPNSYINDSSQKIEIYNRIANINDKSDYDALVEELIDVYGDIPVIVDNIMYVSLIKAIASENGFTEIREINNSIYLFFASKDNFTFEELKYINETYKGVMSLDLSDKPAFIIPAIKTKLLDTYELLDTIKKIRSK